jgi:hypothetical protein
MRRIKITVTQQDIDNANEIRRTPEGWQISTYCPITRACRRALKDDSIRTSAFSLEREGHRTFNVFPKRVMDFIFAYDECRPVQPFSFMLTLP